MNKIVVACFGDDESRVAIERWRGSADVIAVAMDFGGGLSLEEARDHALAAGAVRCHALDVREPFTRECLLPSLGLFDPPTAACAALAPAFALKHLQTIAGLEGATVIEPVRVPIVSRRRPTAAVTPRHLDIVFEQGIPTSINGVAMSLVELMDSLETITGAAALDVLDRHRSLSREPQLA